jgi:acyl-CoA thioesterase FadM
MARIHIDLPSSFIFSTALPVRISDINYGGHLGNDSMLSLLHEARLQFLQKYNYSELDVLGAGIIMSDAAVVFKSEGFYGDELCIEIAVTDFSRVACDFVYRVTNQSTQKEVAHAKTGIVFFDYALRKPVDIPEEFKLLCSRLLKGNETKLLKN